jgi:excinuclease ABC subunit A
VIKCADYVIDLGPEGGAAGGRIVAAGTPEEVARTARSATGQFLVDLLFPAQNAPIQSAV